MSKIFDDNDEEYTNPDFNSKKIYTMLLKSALDGLKHIKIFDNPVVSWKDLSVQPKITESRGVQFLHVFSASAECNLNYFLEKKSYDEQMRYFNKYVSVFDINNIKNNYKTILNSPEYKDLNAISTDEYNKLHFDLGIGIKATLNQKLEHFLLDHMKGDILLDSWDKISNTVTEGTINEEETLRNAINNARVYIIEFKIPLIHEISIFQLPPVFKDRNLVKYLRKLSNQEYIFCSTNKFDIINILHKCSEVHLIQHACTKYKWEDNKFVKCDSTDQHIPLPIKTHEKYTKFGIDPISTSGGSRSNKSNLYKLNKYISKNKQIESLLYNYK